MKKTIAHHLRDIFLPWLSLAVARRALRDVTEENRKSLEEGYRLRRELRSAQNAFAETKHVNIHNAQAHRASEVAALMSNNAQNEEIERLRLMLPGAKQRVVEPRTMPAIHVPTPIPVQEPKKISPP